MSDFSLLRCSSGDWSLDLGGELVIGGQLIIYPRDAKPDGAPFDEGISNCRLFAGSKRLFLAAVDVLHAIRVGGDKVPSLADLRAAVRGCVEGGAM